MNVRRKKELGNSRFSNSGHHHYHVVVSFLFVNLFHERELPVGGSEPPEHERGLAVHRFRMRLIHTTIQVKGHYLIRVRCNSVSWPRRRFVSCYSIRTGEETVCTLGMVGVTVSLVSKHQATSCACENTLIPCRSGDLKLVRAIGERLRPVVI